LWGSDGGDRLVSTVGFVTASHRGGRGAAGGLTEGDGAMGAPPQPLLGMRVEGPLKVSPTKSHLTH
jgi:hypothetical protein